MHQLSDEQVDVLRDLELVVACRDDHTEAEVDTALYQLTCLLDQLGR